MKRRESEYLLLILLVHREDFFICTFSLQIIRILKFGENYFFINSLLTIHIYVIVCLFEVFFLISVFNYKTLIHFFYFQSINNNNNNNISFFKPRTVLFMCGTFMKSFYSYNGLDQIW